MKIPGRKNVLEVFAPALLWQKKTRSQMETNRDEKREECGKGAHGVFI